jgi:hypothetical protein
MQRVRHPPRHPSRARYDEGIYGTKWADSKEDEFEADHEAAVRLTPAQARQQLADAAAANRSADIDALVRQLLREEEEAREEVNGDQEQTQPHSKSASNAAQPEK